MNPFSTRMNRSQFLVSVVLIPFMALLSVSLTITGYWFTVAGILLALYMLTFPIRRLNDIGKVSGLWIIPYFFVPLVFESLRFLTPYLTVLFIPIYIYLLLRKGDPLPNKYGPVPSGFWFKSMLIGQPHSTIEQSTPSTPTQNSAPE